jgi:hypothetical protein
MEGGKRKMKVYAVFLKLQYFYDDNDRMLENLFHKKEDAEAYVEKNKHWQNLIIEEWSIS